MPHKRKGDHCLNCSHPLSTDINFCPNCGQENDNRNVSVWVLAADFIEETIGVDSKLLRSLVPFLLQPGKLTVAFITGQRKLYVPPLRMYLVLSVVYFLFFSLTLDSITEELDSIEETSQAKSDSLVADSAKSKDSLSGKPLKITIGSKGFGLSGSYSLADSGSEEAVTLLEKVGRSAQADTEKIRDQIISISDLKSSKVSDTTIARQLGLDTTTIWLKIIKQGRRFAADKTAAAKELIRFAGENASIAGFLMIPLLALFLKLIYLSRRIKYIAHVVHVLHLQSFLVFIATLNTILDYYVFQNSGSWWQGITEFLMFAAVVIYHIVSCRRVYGQGWAKTLVKNVLYAAYFVALLSFTVVGLLVISFVLF